MYSLEIQRTLGRLTSSEKIDRQIEFIATRALSGGRGGKWDYTFHKLADPQALPAGWLFQYHIDFEKKGGFGDVPRQWENIRRVALQSMEHARFASSPWTEIDGPVVISSTSPTAATPQNNIPGVRTVTSNLTKEIKWDDIHIPSDLLTDRTALSRHPCFSDIYGRDAQIRTCLSALEAAKQTNGQRRLHSVLWGHAGCAKTKILLAIEKLVGTEAVLRLDATSTTRAGLEQLFFNDLPYIPPIVIMEEIEKANEDALKLWLGALDDRGEIRKVNFRLNKVRPLQIVFFCTANDKDRFDAMMGSNGREKGALSSRCVNEIYCPRPDDNILRLILRREIDNIGGNVDWIEPCIDLRHKLGTDDPRRVISYLAGGDRLLNGEYEKDRLEIYQQEQEYLQT
jgi:hypothetical protein